MFNSAQIQMELHGAGFWSKALVTSAKLLGLEFAGQMGSGEEEIK